MLKITYTEKGTAYTDFEILKQAAQIIDDYKNNNVNCVKVSTSNIIDAMRIMVARKAISFEELQIEVNDEIVSVNEYGEYSHYPKQFDWYKKILMELLMAKRKKFENKEEK